MITFAEENWFQALPELQPLFPQHYAELALDQDHVPLDPQWSIYEHRALAGELVLVIGRENGAVIAYFIGFVAPGLHYRTCLTCTMDIFYVTPGNRQGANGVKLFRAVERVVKSRGVQRWFVGAKLHKDAGPLFKRLGFKPVETYYSKFFEG